MKNIKQRFFFYIFLVAVSFYNQAAAQQNAASKSVTNAERTPAKTQVAEENLIHFGDLIDVDVVGSSEFDWRGTLNPEGFLDGINFTGNPIYALCRQEEGVAAKIAESYSKILRAPQVVVKILDRSKRPVSVLFGAVKKNQRFQIKRTVLLNELIIVSGGFTDKVSGEIQILRAPNSNCLSQTTNDAKKGEKDEKFISVSQTAETESINIKIGDLLSGKTNANPQIYNGDIITVLEAKPVYVIGGVAEPKQIAVRSSQPITVSRAVASAGGLAKGADGRRVTIFRRVGTETKAIVADLDKIKSGQAEDVVLLPFDVVEVEQTKRENRKFPPLIRMSDSADAQAEKLPLKIID